MRLIDADKFYINYARRFSREPLKVEFFKQFLDAELTVCDIDAMIDEIQAEKQGYPPSADYYKAISKVYEIIIKHTKGVSDEDN